MKVLRKVTNKKRMINLIDTGKNQRDQATDRYYLHAGKKGQSSPPPLISSRRRSDDVSVGRSDKLLRVKRAFRKLALNNSN